MLLKLSQQQNECKTPGLSTWFYIHTHTQIYYKSPAEGVETFHLHLLNNNETLNSLLVLGYYYEEELPINSTFRKPWFFIFGNDKFVMHKGNDVILNDLSSSAI